VLRERKHARIACEALPGDEDPNRLRARRAVAAEAARRQSHAPDGEELTERERAHVGRLDVNDPGLVMRVSGEMKPWVSSMPIPAGTVTRRPFT